MGVCLRPVPNVEIVQFGPLGTSGVMCHDLAGDQQTRRGSASARPRAAAPCARPDRPGVRAAAGRRGARPRRAHVGRALQPRVPPRLRRVAVRVSDDAAHRARDGAAVSWRPRRHRGLFAVGCASLDTFSARFTELAGVPPSTYRGQTVRATAGMPPCVAKQVTKNRSGFEKRGSRSRS